MNLEPPLDGNSRIRLKPISKALFHSDFAMEAFLLISGKDRFYKAQVATATGCQANYAGEFLRRLEASGLIERIPQEEGQTRHYYRKCSLEVWSTLRRLAEVVIAEPGATVTHLSRRSQT